jgi:hypothetical protein
MGGRLEAAINHAVTLSGDPGIPERVPLVKEPVLRYEQRFGELS